MDSETSTRHSVDLLERMLLDRNAEPTYMPLSLLEDITNCFSDDHQIGSGGFAMVYKGIVGKEMVAVKKLSRTFDLDETKFHKEVECLMKAKHKNIVRFLGYCSDTQGRIADYEGKFVIADIRNWLLCFEYVPNGSLDKYITDASRGLEWRERYEIIKGICEGLLHLHERRILHLDLKPSNILVDDHKLPKITDFGLSRCLDKDQTRAFTSNLYGSQGYMAPEFFGGQVAFASDIYSLGVIIIEILTGEKGYPEDENVVENWMNRLKGSDQWETQLEQVRVCTKIGIECMEFNPKKRPAAHHITDRLEKTASMVETGISSSLVEQQVNFLKEQYCQEKAGKLSSEYLGKDIKERPEAEEVVEYVGRDREDHSQQGDEEGPGNQWSLPGEKDTKQNAMSQARRNYVRNGGPILEKIKSVKLFKKEKLKSILTDDNLIRKGGIGEVYVGFVDREPVVVRNLTSGTMLEIDQFTNEVISQSQVRHKNIIRFIGCCVEVDTPMLVYEYLPKGNLDYTLHSNDNVDKVHLNLGVRLSIAAELAGGLAYMHSMASSKILHGDVKPANILLDYNFVPKISQTSIRRLIAGDKVLIGDMAYMDPVCLQTGLLTEQSDVYSFGIVILELLTRKKVTLTCADNNSLVMNFHENHKKGRKSTELFDKEIALTEDLEILDNLSEIAMECLNHDMHLRPTMVDVAERLKC